MSVSFERLVEQHYAALRRIAARALRNGFKYERMSPTSLVAETVMRLMKQRKKPSSEDHLRGLATVFMVRVLADSRRTRLAQRRGGGKPVRSVHDHTGAIDLAAGSKLNHSTSAASSRFDREELLTAMEELAETLPREMEVVTLHMVAEIPLPRVAKLMELGERTVYRALHAGLKALEKRLDPRSGGAPRPPC